MKKNGFVFIETLVAVIVLASSLLLLYSSFHKILQSEKTRVYYDDVNYLYRTWYIKDRLNTLNFMAVLKELTNNPGKYFVTVGPEYGDLFKNNSNENNFISSLWNDFEVTQVIVLKENKLDNLKACTVECSMDNNCDEYENCNGMYTNLEEDFIKFLKNMYIDVPCTYVLVAGYRTCDTTDSSKCHNYYSWVSV